MSTSIANCVGFDIVVTASLSIIDILINQSINRDTYLSSIYRAANTNELRSTVSRAIVAPIITLEKTSIIFLIFILPTSASAAAAALRNNVYFVSNKSSSSLFKLEIIHIVKPSIDLHERRHLHLQPTPFYFQISQFNQSHPSHLNTKINRPLLTWQ